MTLIPMPQDRTTDGPIPPALPTLADPADQFGHVNRRAGYGSESRAALVERQTRAGGAMEAGVGAALYARIDALTAERDALRADAARLDWLEAHAVRAPREGGWWGLYKLPTPTAYDHSPYSKARGEGYDHPSLRGAIDAAMQGRGAA